MGTLLVSSSWKCQFRAVITEAFFHYLYAIEDLQIFWYSEFPRHPILDDSSVLIPVQSTRSRVCGLLASLFNEGYSVILERQISLDKKLQSRDVTFLLACDVIKQQSFLSKD